MRYFVVDAFADELFKGNPAGVCLMDKWPGDTLMQNIAAENNLAETAFLVPGKDGYGLRWFTPEEEMDLCGHGTLGSACVIALYIEPEKTLFRFHSVSGLLTVERKGDLYELDFPTRVPHRIPVTPAMEEALGTRVVEAYLSRDMMFLLGSEQEVAQAQPDLEKLGAVPGCSAAMITARGEAVDFVSRFFTPGASVAEDPVTGSAHSTLIPFWAERLGKEELVARQISKRGGTLYCRYAGDRVKIAGKAVPYLTGEIHYAFGGG